MGDDRHSIAGSNRGRPIPANASNHQRTESTPSAAPASPSRASVTARLAEPIPAGSPSAAAQSQWRSPSIQGRVEQDAPLAGATGTSVPGPGPSSLSQALRGELSGRQSPPTAGPSRHRPSNSGRERMISPDRGSQWESGPGSFAAGPQAAQLGRSPRNTGTEDIEILKRHLVNPSQAGSEPGSYSRRSGFPAEAESAIDNEEFSSLQLQGGDTTRHIYRYAEKRERELAENDGRGPGRIRRSFSYQVPRSEDDPSIPDVATIKIPGGFRREHIRRAAASPAPSSVHKRRDYGTATSAPVEPERQQPQFVANNFIEFLTLYGHFAGEELAEDDEDLGPDEYFSSDAYDDSTADGDERRSDEDRGERSALLSNRRRRRKRKHRDAGKASPIGAAMLLLKSFVGTGVLFLPRAYLNGGMTFANAVLVAIALLSYYCFLLLVSVRLKVHASFGDMGEKIFGTWFKGFINFSLVLSQIGFTSAYTVFTAENLQAFVLAITKCRTEIDVGWFILMQTAIFLPVSLYRNINNIQKLALVADLFIALGLIYIYYYDVRTMVKHHGVADIQHFNPKDWTLFIGTAIFTFEGIGLIIPIQSSMHDPRKFPKVLGSVMVIISVIFISAGAVSYAAYGSKTKTVILLNLPQDDKLVNAVQFLYSLAILFSTPLQIYPAIEITSQQLFSRTGKYNPWIKWQKNFFRFAVVLFCAALAYFGASDLDKFVALVGSFACIPLVYIYPPMMHYKVVSTRTWQKVTNVMLVIFGFAIMTYTTALTIQAWAEGHDKEPGYCDAR